METKTEVREVSVDELRSLFASNEYDIEIATPDGFQPVVNWWDKGLLEMVRVTLDNGMATECAVNHLIQCIDGDELVWVLAGELAEGAVVLTTNGPSPVSSVEEIEDAECFDFEVGHPNHRYWGDGIASHNSGKSYIVSGNIIKDCQKKGVFPVLVDTENALDNSWLHALGVSTDPEELFKVRGATVDDVSKMLGEAIDLYRDQNKDKAYEDKAKMMIIIDSLGMLITPNQEKQFMEGDQKGDMGLKAKQITNMMRVIMAKIASEPIGLMATNHVYDSQDQYKPDVIPGGKMLEFASSVIVQMNKLLLKEDEYGNKLIDPKEAVAAGIRSSMVVRKSRYAKPFEKVFVSIPYDKGMDPYSGLFNLFEKKGVIQKDGARYTYTSPVTGEIFKDWRKNFQPTGILDQIMTEWEHWENAPVGEGFDDTGSSDETME